MTVSPPTRAYIENTASAGIPAGADLFSRDDCASRPMTDGGGA